MLSDKLAIYLRLRAFSSNPDSIEQYNSNDIIRMGDYDYFIQYNQMLDLGDHAYEIKRVVASGERLSNIQRQVGRGQVETLKGIAFTSKPQAESYLVSEQMLVDFSGQAKPKNPKQAKPETPEEQNKPEYGDFEIAFAEDSDDPFTV